MKDNYLDALLLGVTQLKRAWGRDDQPTQQPGLKGTQGPRDPCDTGARIRLNIHHSLHFWVRAALDEEIGVGNPVNGADTMALLTFLHTHASTLAGWQYAPALVGDIRDHARQMRTLTEPPPPSIKLGPCPRPAISPIAGRTPAGGSPTIGGPDTRTGGGNGGTCGGIIRADVDRPSDVKCPRCHTVDTIEGWQRRMVGNLPPEPASQLIKRLANLGYRITESRLRKWASIGWIPKPVGYQGKQGLYDPQAVMRALMSREDRLARGEPGMRNTK